MNPEAFGFEDGAIVATIEPEVYQDAPEPREVDPQETIRAIRCTVELLLDDRTPDRIFRRLQLMAYSLGCTKGAKSLDELGRRIGVSKQAAHKGVDGLDAIFRRNFADLDGPG